METKDKRVKREIANSNERRRMQSINAGFQKLKRLLPITDGEKLSKAAILQSASDFIQQIEREKHMLYEQNTLLRGILLEVKGGTDIFTALETTDLDAPIIPLHTHIAQTTDNLNSSTTTTTTTTTNNSTENNSNDDCVQRNAVIKEVHKQQGNKQEQNKSTTKNVDNIECSHNNNTSNFLVSTGVAKAAIALPLEVPYTSETAIMELHPDAPHSARKEDLTPIDPQDPSSKGQNLDTICKAIIQIEGDRVFNSENIKQETQ